MFEPRFLQLFQDLADKAPGRTIEGTKFGHLLNPDVAPPALLAEGHVGGMPRVGVLATVKGVSRNPDGSLMVEYEGSKRIRLLSIWTSEPYLVGRAPVVLCSCITPFSRSGLGSLVMATRGGARGPGCSLMCLQEPEGRETRGHRPVRYGDHLGQMPDCAVVAWYWLPVLQVGLALRGSCVCCSGPK